MNLRGTNQHQRSRQQGVVELHAEDEYPDGAISETGRGERDAPRHRAEQTEYQRRANHGGQCRTWKNPERSRIGARHPMIGFEEVRISPAKCNEHVAKGRG